MIAGVARVMLHRLEDRGRVHLSVRTVWTRKFLGLGIGVIAALLIAAMALLFAGRAFGQTAHTIAISSQHRSVLAIARDSDGHHLVLTYGTGKISGVAILNWP